jgi:hypothetical protein
MGNSFAGLIYYGADAFRLQTKRRRLQTLEQIHLHILKHQKEGLLLPESLQESYTIGMIEHSQDFNFSGHCFPNGVVVHVLLELLDRNILSSNLN